MGYKVVVPEVSVGEQDGMPSIIKDSEGTTSWRDAKKALRQWYLDQAKALRAVTEKDYFSND